MSKKLPLPTSTRFWRDWLADPACEFHGLTGVDRDSDPQIEQDRQLADLRDRGVLPWEAAAIVLAQFPAGAEPGSYEGNDKMPLAFRAGAVVMDQYLAMASDGQIDAETVRRIDRRWHDLAKAAGILPID